MKKRALSILLACVFLLSVFMFCTTAFASEPVSNTADGLAAVLDTDKDAYVAGENINVTLDVENTSIYVNNIRTELIIPEGVTLEEGILQNAAALKVGESVQFAYVLGIPVVETPTTQAPTTAPGGDNSPETRDITMLIYGSLAIVSLLGLIALTFGAKLMKQRWLVLVVCAAMLLGVVGPLAVNAAVSEKSFEIVKAITIDGAAAEVKAVVTYDLDDNELMESTDVPYKADGQFLWNLGEVEQGYYLPSDVSYDGKTTSKDGSYRPEVTAPYIDMLFGTAKVSGMYKVEDLFNAEAEQSVLIGRTDDYASLKALAQIDEDEWIVTIVDGKLVVTGWYDNATVAAVKWLKEQVTADAADIALKLPHKGKMDYVDVDLPAVDFGMFLNGIDSDQGNVMLRWNEVDDADFEDYCDALEAAGYELYQENSFSGYKGAGGCFFATYVKGDDVVQVQYLKVSLLCEDPATLNSDESKAYTAACRIDGDEIRLVLSNRDTLGNNEAANNATGWKDEGIVPKMHLINMPTGDNNGMCQIITLADGSFIVIDGGVAGVTDTVYETLVAHNERADGKIVIAAWVLTHDHTDHTAVFQELANSDRAESITVEQVIVNKAPDSLSWRTLSDPYGYAMGWLGAINNVHVLAEKFAGEAQVVTAHMGQIMHIRNAELEFLSVGSEDVFPVIINNDNACSLVFRVTFDGIYDVRDDGDVDNRHSILIFGDSALDQTYNVYFPLFIDELHGDIIQVAHHGLGGQTSRLTPLIKDEDVAVFCMTWPPAIDPQYGDLWYRGQNNGLQPPVYDEEGNVIKGHENGTTGLNIICDEYVYTLVLPFDWETDPVQKTVINQYKSDFFDSEEVKLAVLPVFRFGGDIEGRLDAFKEYVLADDPDVLALTVFDWMADRYNGKDIDTIKLMAKELGYAFSYYAPAWACDRDGSLATGEGTIGQLILSRYPIAKAETIVLNEGTAYDSSDEGRSVGHVVLDMSGLLVDIYATHFGTGDAIAENWNAFADAFAPEGEYWFILGNTKDGSATSVAGKLGLNAVQQAWAGTQLNIIACSDAILSDGAYDSTIAGAICPNFDQYVRVTAKLSRKVLCDDLEIGEFDDIPSVGQWWVNYLNQATNREQVARWLLKNKHEVVGLVHIPSELLDDEFAAYFAELVGYPYYHVVEIPNPNYGVPYGHMLLSAYPLEPQADIIIRSEEASTSKLTAESYGHVIVDMTGTALNTKVDFIFGDMDANDNNGLQMTAQRAALEAAIKDITDASGLPFVLLSGYDNGHIKNLETYAGKEFNHQTHPWSNCIVASAPLPMSGREFFGTTKYPENGESPIKIVIPNVDPYVKADLAAIPEYQVTVEGGLGSGTFQEGKTVAVTANKAPYGKAFDKWIVVSGDGVVFEDATSAKTTFTMIGGEVTVKATYKDVPVEVKEPTGQTVSLKVAVEPTFRYSIKWNQEGAKDMILNHYRTVDADVLALTLIDKNVATYNGVDVVGIICEELADLYSYTYYAPGNVVGNGSLETGESTYGHLILSKFPIEFYENIMLTDNGGAAEDRSVNHVVIKLDDNTLVDLYATHMGTASSEWPVLAANFNQQGDYFFILGNTKIKGNGKTADDYLGTTGTVAGCAADITILASKGITFNEQCAADSSVSNVLKPNMDPLHAATVTIPLLSEAVTKYAVNVDGVAQGYFAAGEEVSLTAPNPGVGKRFKNWVLPEGLTLTEGTVNDKNIKFTMPAGILNLTTNNNEVDSFFLTVNGTQVGEYEPGQTVKVTAPAAEVGKIFAGWTIPAGVELKQGYLSAYMTIEFVMPAKDLDLTATYVDVNTSAAYPTISALGSDIQDLKFTYAWGLDNKDTVIAKLTDSLNKGYKVAVYLNTKLTAAEVADIAAASGYDYYMYTVGNHFMLSDYPFVHKDTMEYVGGQPRSYNYVTLDVNGTLVDLYFGENTGGNGGTQNKEIVEPWLKHHASQSSNPFFFISYSASSAVTDVFVGLNRDAAANEDGWINLLRSDGTAFVSAEAKSGKIDRGYIYHASFSVAKKTTYRAASWRVDYSNGLSDAHRTNIVNWFADVAQADYQVIAGVDLTKSGAKESLMAEAAAYGYPYYSFVADSATSTRGTMLLSKYPLTEVETFFSGDVQFKKVQTTAWGKTVDIYFGSHPNWAATAYDNTNLFAKLDASKAAGNPTILMGYFVWQSAGSYSGKDCTSNSGNDMCVIAAGLKKGANAVIPDKYTSKWPSEIMLANFAAPSPTNFVYANLELK